MATKGDNIKSTSITDELELINQKKSALQRLVKLTSNLNRLNQGLQSVLILGKSVINISPKILDSFKLLRNKLEPLPTPKLQHTLSATEIKIQNDIKQVLEITQKDDSQLDEYLSQKGEKLIDSIEESFSEYVNNFKKKAQASIAIRIVLKSRFALSSAFLLPVPESFIKKQIRTLDKRENRYRKRIKQELITIYKDVSRILSKNSYSDEINEHLNNTRDTIIDNIKHINAGKSLENLPLNLESIQLASDTEEPQITDDKPEQQAEVKDEPEVVEVLAKIEELEIKPLKRGIMSRLFEWSTTPLDHSWSDTEHKQ